MTKKQIEVLLNAEEIIPSGWNSEKHPNPEVEMIKFQAYPIFYNDKKGYALNDNLIKTLNQVFELYLSFESLRIAFLWLEKFELLMQKTSNEQEIILLKNNVQKELKRKQYFQEKLPAWVVQFLQPGWMYLQRSNLEKLIEVLKFKVLEGQAIVTFDRKKCSENYSLNYLDEFFKKSNELNPVYQIVAADKKLEYLQTQINQLDGQINQTKTAKKNPRKLNSNKNFTYKEIAIAYLFLKEFINKENAASILKKHSQQKCDLQLVRVARKNRNPSDLTKIRHDKTADKRHLESLMRAERLIISLKNKNAENDINRIITGFRMNFDKKY